MKSISVRLSVVLTVVIISTNFLFCSDPLEEFFTAINLIFDNGTFMIYLGSKDGLQEKIRYNTFEDDTQIGEVEFFEIGYWYSKAKVVKRTGLFQEGNFYVFKLKEPLKKEISAPIKPPQEPKKLPIKKPQIVEVKPEIKPITKSPSPPSKKQKNSFFYTMVQYETQSSDSSSDDFLYTTLLYGIISKNKHIINIAYNYINNLSDSTNSNDNIGLSFISLYSPKFRSSFGTNYFMDTLEYHKSNSYFFRCDLTFPSFIANGKFNFYPIYDKKDISLFKLNLDHILPISNKLSFDLTSGYAFDLENNKDYKIYHRGTNLSYKPNKKVKFSVGYKVIKVKSPTSYNINSLRFSMLKQL